MRKRWLLFSLCFIAFYYLLHLAYDMPNIIHGSSRFMDWPGNARGLALRIADLLNSFLFALIPYLILFYYYPRKKIILALGCILLALPVLFFLRYQVEESLIIRKRMALFTPSVRWRTYFYNHVFYIILYTVYGMAFYFIRYSYFKEMQQKDLVLQNRESELSFLRSQINPHFLFNTLNTLYGTALQENAQRTATGVQRLGDMMRFLLHDNHRHEIPLSRELEYLKNYMALQQLRIDQSHGITIETSIHECTTDRLIAPMLLIPFIENAFKHGVSAVQPSRIDIQIRQEGHKIFVEVKNTLFTDKRAILDESNGIGLANTQNRLDLLYPGKYQLEVTENKEEKEFEVHLELETA